MLLVVVVIGLLFMICYFVDDLLYDIGKDDIGVVMIEVVINCFNVLLDELVEDFSE